MNKKTIKIHQYTLDVYENGEIFCHEQVVVRGDGRLQVRKPHYKTQSDNGNGYMYIKLWINKRVLSFYIHRLVATAFHSNEYNLPQVNHIDGVRNNNHYSNLEWCTASYNVQDYVKKGRGVYGWKTVIQFNRNGEIVNEYNSIKEASVSVGCTPENIGMSISKVGESKTAAGFFWIFKSDYNNTIHTTEFIKNKFINPNHKKTFVYKNGSLAGEFSSSSKAAKFINPHGHKTAISKILECARGKRNQYLGYTFKVM
jgi:hypothetical protein